MKAALEVRDLSIDIVHRGLRHRVVDAVELTVAKGECVALVGESGSGKTLTALSVLRLLPDAAKVCAGSVFLDGTDLLGIDEEALRTIRGNQASMIFQDPMSYLNPLLRVDNQLLETWQAHDRVPDSPVDVMLDLLHSVGLKDARRVLRSYPHELSGGMRQRVIIAIAMACSPGLLIADEPTTALDVTTQAQIMDVLGALRQVSGTGLLLITHDLGLVAGHCSRVYVMYAGQIVEHATTPTLFRSPRHPYTTALLNSSGSVDRKVPLRAIPGQPPVVGAFPSGCRFHPRCPSRLPSCSESEPPWHPISAGTGSRCWLEVIDAKRSTTSSG